LTPEVFAAPVGSDSWLAECRQEVALRLPPSTTEIASGGVTGWAFSITDDFAHRYSFWLAYDADDGQWHVYLVSPRRDELGPPGRTGPENAHAVHLFPDGRVCLTPTVGCRSIEHAFARAALWCRGASCYRSGVEFQLNPDQRG
jgi:hypothetical protein